MGRVSLRGRCDFSLHRTQQRKGLRTMSFGEAIQPIEMLLVEDNPGDVRLTAEALKEIKQEINLSVVGDGVEALAFLRKQGKYAGSARPRLAFLDLNLPKKNGHEVLEEIKFDPDLRGIPVIVLTTSQSDNDVRRAHELGAHGCITKPTDLDTFIRVMKSIESTWLTAARPPGN